jgi:hypothetical protein
MFTLWKTVPNGNVGLNPIYMVHGPMSHVSFMYDELFPKRKLVSSISASFKIGIIRANSNQNQVHPTTLGVDAPITNTIFF